MRLARGGEILSHMVVRRIALVAVLVVVAAGCSQSAERGGDASPAPSPSPSPGVLRLDQPRAVHRATELTDGTVLITGGCTEEGCGGFDAGTRSELYDPQRGLVVGPSMITPRASGTATLLEDGRVLLTGGYVGEGEGPTAHAEVYAPRRNEFLPVADLAVARADHTASLLPDGRVVIAGGFDESGTALASTEIFDPASDSVTAGPELSAARAGHVTATVGDTVVLVGGTESSEAVASTDVLDDGAWRPGPQLSTPRVKLGVAAIGPDRLLVVGGATDVEGRERLPTTEIVDLARGAVEKGPELSQGEYKLDGAIAVLEDGRVVIPSGSGLAVFDPETELLARLPVTTYPATSFRTITAMGDGRLLLAGGYDAAITPTDQAMVVAIPAAAEPG